MPCTSSRSSSRCFHHLSFSHLHFRRHLSSFSFRFRYYQLTSTVIRQSRRHFRCLCHLRFLRRYIRLTHHRKGKGESSGLYPARGVPNLGRQGFTQRAPPPNLRLTTTVRPSPFIFAVGTNEGFPSAMLIVCIVLPSVPTTGRHKRVCILVL